MMVRVQFEIDAGKDFDLEQGSANKNCLGKVTEKIRDSVKDLTDGSTEYAKFCAQSVLEGYE